MTPSSPRWDWFDSGAKPFQMFGKRINKHS